MQEVKLYAIIFIGLFLFFAIGFSLGALVSCKIEGEAEQNKADKIYCFQCEIEMPTKVKGGVLCCSNCGLTH